MTKMIAAIAILLGLPSIGVAQNGTINTPAPMFQGKNKSSFADPNKYTATDTSQKNSKDKAKNGSSGTCAGEKAAAETACGVLQMTPALTAAIANLSATGSTGDMAKACKAAKTINTIAGSANVAFATTCWKKVNSCKSVCSSEYDETNEQIKTARGDTTITVSISELIRKRDKAEEYGKVCSGMKQSAYMGFAQAATNATGVLMSGACKSQSEALQCETLEDLQNKAGCVAILCDPVTGKYANLDVCPALAGVDCTKDINAGERQCICEASEGNKFYNPTNPICPQVNAMEEGPIPGTDQNGNTTNVNNDDGGYSDGELAGLLGTDPQGKLDVKKDNAPNANGQMQPGSPFAPGGGGFSGNGAGNGKGGAGKGPYNTDILQGTGGSGGYSGGGGGGYPFGSAEGKSKDGINLRDFLPNGKRGLAGKVDLSAQGLSDKNGLTNFQKVTRQVNELRRTKQTIETK